MLNSSDYAVCVAAGAARFLIGRRGGDGNFLRRGEKGRDDGERVHLRISVDEEDVVGLVTIAK